jgi:hypothetical protein
MRDLGAEVRRMRVEAHEAALAQRHPARDVGVGPLGAAAFAGDVADCGNGEAAEDGLWFGGAHFLFGKLVGWVACLVFLFGLEVVGGWVLLVGWYGLS